MAGTGYLPDDPRNGFLVQAESGLSTNDVDTRLPIARTVTLGFQHVLVMYAGAVTVPLIVGAALKLPAAELAVLINADLLCCGLVSLVQCLGIGRHIGIRLPVMMGVSYAGIGPMVAIGSQPEMGLRGLYGAVIAAGLICFILVPMLRRLLGLFPPLVTGTSLLALGIGLLGVAVPWAAGGSNVPDFASSFYLGTAALVIGVALLVARFAHGFLANVGVLAGIIVGTSLAAAFGRLSFAGIDSAPWLEMVRPFQFGAPRFEGFAVITMTLAVLVAMIESIGLFFSLGEIVERQLSAADFARGLRADALGAAIGGIFNTFPYTSYGQNIGLVGITGVRSRFVCVAGALILMALAMVPKAAHLVAGVPRYVLGGAAIVMFGMVAGSGMRILQAVDFKTRRHNMMIFAISLGIGMIPTLSPEFFRAFPPYLAPLLHSGVLMSMLTAIGLNLLFNGVSQSHLADASASRTVARHAAL
jgi:NCS2 family nucleobase:cation symporter-2